MSTDRLTKMLKKRSEFTARGSNCPICGQSFRGCDHSLAQVDEHFEQKVFEARLAKSRTMGRATEGEGR